MAKRTTIDIRTLLDMVNDRLAQSTDSPDARLALCTLIESVLMDADVYNGFGYLDAEQVPKGQKPGIMYASEYAALPDCDNAVLAKETVHGKVFPDESRRNYAIHPKLAAKRHSLFMPSGAE